LSENAGLTACTTSPPQSTHETVVTCTLQTLENGIAVSEWNMMYNDAAEGNGHRDTILNPTMDHVSIGVAYDTTSEKVYFVEDFEDTAVQLAASLASGSEMTLTGTTSAVQLVQDMAIFYDPVPTSLSTSALGSEPYNGSCGQGQFAGGVIPDPHTTFVNGTTVRPDSWTVTGGGSISISFSMSEFIEQYGSGVYTIWVWVNSTTYVTSISVFIKT